MLVRRRSTAAAITKNAGWNKSENRLVLAYWSLSIYIKLVTAGHGQQLLYPAIYCSCSPVLVLTADLFHEFVASSPSEHLQVIVR